MVQYWVLLAVSGYLFMGDTSADQCPSTSTTNFRFSVASRRNVTGQWKVMVDTERLMAAGERGGIAIDVEQFTSRCNDKEAIHLLSSASAESPIVPPPGYELVLGPSYYKFHNEGDWETARQTCVREGAQLLITDNNLAVEVLGVFYTRYKSIIEKRSYDALHVGYFDPTETGNFISILGKPVSKDQWDPGQPQKGSYYCAVAIKSGRLYARKCNNIRSFICEIKIDL